MRDHYLVHKDSDLSALGMSKWFLAGYGDELKEAVKEIYARVYSLEDFGKRQPAERKTVVAPQSSKSDSLIIPSAVSSSSVNNLIRSFS